AALPAPAAHGGELPRIEPRPGQGRACGDGPARRARPPAARPGPGADPRPHAGGAGSARPLAGRRTCRCVSGSRRSPPNGATATTTPMYVNVGAYVGAGTMIDSQALVGSCAQIGRRVHLAAAARIGGVLEPVAALPVIVEDDVLVGGGCGIYEGTIVREGAVLAPGTTLTGSTPVHDLVRDAVYRRDDDRPLEIPAGAVVVPGARAAPGAAAARWGISLYAPVVVKYRDAKTD